MTKYTPEVIKNRLSNIGEAIGTIALEYIVELEEEIEQLKLINKKMRCCQNCKNVENFYCICDNCIHFGPTPINDNKYKDKWELAELKDDNKVMVDNYSKMEQKFYNQLTKLKGIVKRFLEFVNNEVEYDPENPEVHTKMWNELCEEAEQFLKE